ncbi:MAG: DUF5615 family PIN-like protein [Phycisphaeraceae bacterium]
MLRAFADEHVDAAVIEAVRKLGVDVITVQEHGLSGSVDEVLLSVATKEGRLMLTSDKDFLKLHAEWLKAGKDHAGIVFWKLTKYSVGNAVRRIMGIVRAMTVEDAKNNLIYL